MKQKLKKLSMIILILSIIGLTGYGLYLIPAKLAVLCMFGLFLIKSLLDRKYRKSVDKAFVAIDKRLKMNHQNLIKVDKNFTLYKSALNVEIGRIKRSLE